MIKALFLVPLLAAVAVAAPARRAASDLSGPNSDELFKTYSPAVVKIVVRLHGVPVLVGSGFFVAADGTLFTNKHVLKNVLFGTGFTAEFILRDKHVIKEFQVGHCGDEKQIDLCLVKIAVKPKAYFKLSANRPGENDPAYTIGHPRGMDFSIAYGLVKGYRQNALGSNEMLVTTGMGPGSSGGPLFDNQGQLIGIASKYSAIQGRENVAIPLDEVSQFLSDSQNFMPVAEAKTRFTEYMRESLRNKREAELDPAIAQAKKGESLAARKDFTEHTFDFGSQKLTVNLPKIFDGCRQEDGPGTIHACFGYGDSIVFTVQRFPTRNSPLAAQNGKKLLGPKPLLLVQQLQHDGAWAPIEKILTPLQRDSFHSEASPARCSKFSAAKGSIFNESESCEFSVVNDNEPGALSQNLWIENGANIFALSVWLNDASLENYFGKFPVLAALTARAPTAASEKSRIEKGLQDKRLNSYSVTFAENYEFMGSKIDVSNGHYDFYAFRGSRGFEDFPLYSVTETSDLVLPPSYDTQAVKLAAAAAKVSDVTIQPNALLLGSFEVGKSPARILSGVGKDRKGRDAVVLACVMYGKNLNHIMTKVLPANDSSASFRSFKDLCANFRLKTVGALEATP